MAATTDKPTRPKSKFVTVADVQRRLGDIPPERVLINPTPGTATVQDLLDTAITLGRPCELVDGILVEKTMGYREGGLGLWIGTLINVYLMENNVGYAAGSDGMIRFKLDLVRLPDVSFIRWDSVRDPNEIVHPTGAFLEYPPDLAIEVIRPSNTRREMAIKLDEYAKAGVKMVWYIDPDTRQADIFPNGREKKKQTIGIDGVLDGGTLLPGFRLPMAKVFENRIPAVVPKPTKKGKKS